MMLVDVMLLTLFVVGSGGLGLGMGIGRRGLGGVYRASWLMPASA